MMTINKMSSDNHRFRDFLMRYVIKAVYSPIYLRVPQRVVVRDPIDSHLESPKSINCMWQSESRRMFSGFRSRNITPALCRKSKDKRLTRQ